MVFRPILDGFWEAFYGMGMFCLKHVLLCLFLFLLFVDAFTYVFLHAGVVWMALGMTCHSFPPVFLLESFCFCFFLFYASTLLFFAPALLGWLWE